MRVVAYALFVLGLFFLVMMFVPFFGNLSHDQIISMIESTGTAAIAFFVGSATAKYLSRQ